MVCIASESLGPAERASVLVVLAGEVLFTECFETLWFWRGLQQKGCIVSEDADHDHYNKDGQQDPVAQGRVQEQRLRRGSHDPAASEAISN